MQQNLQEHQHRAERIETLIEELSALSDEQARATAQELVQLLLDIYGEGLAHILELTVQAREAGRSLVEMFARDDLVGSLLLLHDLHPIDIETRIIRALDDARPYIKSQGGSVEFIGINNGVTHLRLTASSGCSSSIATLKATIEDVLHKMVPDLECIQIEGSQAPRRPDIPIAYVRPRRHKDSVR